MGEQDNETGRDSERGPDGSRGGTMVGALEGVGHAIRGGAGVVAGRATTVAGTIGSQGGLAVKKVSSGGRVAGSAAKQNAVYLALGLFLVGLVTGAMLPLRRWLRGLVR